MFVAKMIFRAASLVVFLLITPLLVYAQSPRAYWVYFGDKGRGIPSSGTLSRVSSELERVKEIVQPRALARRSKVLPINALLDAEDLPIYQPYIDAIVASGGRLKQQSRWMNAASFYLSDDVLQAVKQFMFVKTVTPVVIMRTRNEDARIETMASSPLTQSGIGYGRSINQVQMINVPALHQIGVTGKGVLVGMLDTGFRWRFHESLNTRHVIAEYDFINHDSITANQTGDASSQDQHGTLTMSTLGGCMPDSLIGPAYDADFILGKTEYVPTETQIEEDNWAAGIEWMEAYGVDVVSSSLGYNIFDDGTGYRFSNGDFNGRTSVTAKAAVRAARLGVLVCDAMGNEGNGNGVIGTMLSPADADSIVSVGAVSFARQLAGFSSTGPTNDNRVKPDVVAPGVGVYCASTAGPNAYFSVSGTSLATPLAAGAAALVLSARPDLTPVQVRDALRNSADTIATGRFPVHPNNFTGWGLVNALNAALSFGPIFSNVPEVSVVNSQNVVAINAVSKFGIVPNEVILHYVLGAAESFSSTVMHMDTSIIFPSSGRYAVTIPPQSYETLVRFYIEARDSSGQSYQSPPLSTNSMWQMKYGIPGVDRFDTVSARPVSYQLIQNFPNPFNPGTTIKYILPTRQHALLKVYDVLGREVATLVDEVQDPGTKLAFFRADGLSSGVYFYRLTTPSFSSTRKMIHLR